MHIYLTISYVEAERFYKRLQPKQSHDTVTNTVFDKVDKFQKKGKKQNVQQLLEVGQ